MERYHKHFSTRRTPQSEPIPGREGAMVQNNAGGYTFQADDWNRLERFLVLGTDGGSYYVSERKLTIENAKVVQNLLSVDGPRVVKTITDISTAGRAPKQGPALFALAMASALGDEMTKRAAFDAVPVVARTATHLMNMAEYRKAFAGWGQGWMKAVAGWYTSKQPSQVAYQVTKYRQRDGWTHRDLLRLSHPRPQGNMDLALGWAAGKVFFKDGAFFCKKKVGMASAKNVKWVADPERQLIWPAPLRIIEGYERLKASPDVATTVGLIEEYKATWEMVPTEHLGDAKVWAALLPHMPMGALIRNLGRMTANGLLEQGADEVRTVVDKLSDQEALKKARIHPIGALSALYVYRQGHGARGKMSWSPVSRIIDVLDDVFYATFDHIEPTGRPICLAIDISGSMMWPQSALANVPGLKAREGAAVMAMATARVEREHEIVAFSDGITPVNISPRQRLDDVLHVTGRLPFGGTDCSLPMLWASSRSRNTKPFDAFAIYTDNETWAGRMHPSQALQEYRQKTGRPSKLVVVGMVGNKSTIADPDDFGMMDVVGFDTSTPRVISDFIRG